MTIFLFFFANLEIQQATFKSFKLNMLLLFVHKGVTEYQIGVSKHAWEYVNIVEQNL